MSQSASFWGALFTVMLPCCGPVGTRLPALPGYLQGLSTQRCLGQATLTVRSGRRSRKGLLEDTALRQCDWCPRQREQCGHRYRGWNSPTLLLRTEQLRQRGCWEGGGLLRLGKPLTFPPMGTSGQGRISAGQCRVRFVPGLLCGGKAGVGASGRK